MRKRDAMGLGLLVGFLLWGVTLIRFILGYDVYYIVNEQMYYGSKALFISFFTIPSVFALSILIFKLSGEPILKMIDNIKRKK